MDLFGPSVARRADHEEEATVIPGCVGS
jgi:hypothetical protein